MDNCTEKNQKYCVPQKTVVFACRGQRYWNIVFPPHSYYLWVHAKFFFLGNTKDFHKLKNLELKFSSHVIFFHQPCPFSYSIHFILNSSSWSEMLVFQFWISYNPWLSAHVLGKYWPGIVKFNSILFKITLQKFVAEITFWGLGKMTNVILVRTLFVFTIYIYFTIIRLLLLVCKSHIIIYKVKDPPSYRLYKNHQAHKFSFVLLEISKYRSSASTKCQHNLLKRAMWTDLFSEMYSQFYLRVFGVKTADDLFCTLAL